VAPSTNGTAAAVGLGGRIGRVWIFVKIDPGPCWVRNLESVVRTAHMGRLIISKAWQVTYKKSSDSLYLKKSSFWLFPKKKTLSRVFLLQFLSVRVSSGFFLFIYLLLLALPF
jgi:hypothetical protein